MLTAHCALQRREELKQLITPRDEVCDQRKAARCLRALTRAALSQAEEEEEDKAGAAVPTTAVSYPGVTVTIAPLDAGDEPPRRGAGRTSVKKR